MGTLEKNLTRFRENFPLSKVIVHNDYLSYKVKPGYQVLASELANELIEKLNLDLVAIPDNVVNGNSFTVKATDYEL